MRSARIQFLLALSLLALSLAGYFFWYRAVAAASQQAQALAASVGSAAAANEKARQSKDAQSLLAADQAAVGRYFLADADVVPFLEALQALGAQTGADVSVVSVGADPAKSAALAVALHITGSFAAVVRTAGAIEYAPYDLAETSLAVVSDGKGAWHADLALSVGTALAASSAPAASAGPAPPPKTPAAPAGLSPQTAPL
ncbi:MAG TPA: hypothetical protein VHC68_02470 [Candidatus Paceibacterota bacterium]|nr:hypothetical protein [Candidatus Paceibacterota bacterium]